MKILDKLLGSLDTNTVGSFSARKLTAFTICAMTVTIEIVWLCKADWHYLPEVLGINTAFISALLGLTTYEYIKKAKDNENKP